MPGAKREATSARNAVSESPTEVETANDSGMPGERFGTRSPRPSTRNIWGAIQTATESCGARRCDHGHTTRRASTAQASENHITCNTKTVAGSITSP